MLFNIFYNLTGLFKRFASSRAGSPGHHHVVVVEEEKQLKQLPLDKQLIPCREAAPDFINLVNAGGNFFVVGESGLTSAGRADLCSTTGARYKFQHESDWEALRSRG